MKTVAEWAEYWAIGKAMEVDQWVRAIQRDALEAAAKVCDAKPDGRKQDWHAGYDTACRHCSEDIRALIQKAIP